MYRTIAQLYSDLTPEELKIWNCLQERGNFLRTRSTEAERENAALRTTNSNEYIKRLHASIERNTEETKNLADELLLLVKNHSKVIREWKRNNSRAKS